MKKTNKIISLLGAISIVASMFSAFAISANAASTPVITLEGVATGKTNGSELTLSVKYTNDVDDDKITMMQGIIEFDTDYLSFKESTKDLVKSELSKTNPSQVKYAFVAMDEDAYLTTKEQAVTTIKFNIIKDIDKNVEFTTSGMKVAFENGGEYTVGGTNALTVNTYTLAPDPTITVAAESGTVVKGESTKVTATPANFAEAPTEYIWTVEGKTSDATKVDGTGAEATLIIGADETAATVTVKATVGEVSGTTTVNVADKIYPLTITPASDFDSDNRITLNIAPTPGEGYVAGTPYDVVAQFYTADGTASGYVEIKNLTDNQTLIVGSQNAGKVNVTLSNENGIIGRLEK